jgi:hypothetical protein
MQLDKANAAHGNLVDHTGAAILNGWAPGAGTALEGVWAAQRSGAFNGGSINPQLPQRQVIGRWPPAQLPPFVPPQVRGWPPTRLPFVLPPGVMPPGQQVYSRFPGFVVR